MSTLTRVNIKTHSRNQNDLCPHYLKSIVIGIRRFNVAGRAKRINIYLNIVLVVVTCKHHRGAMSANQSKATVELQARAITSLWTLGRH